MRQIALEWAYLILYNILCIDILQLLYLGIGGINIALTQQLFGRRVLYTDVDEVTMDNILDVLAKVLPTHTTNRNEIEYLYNYYKGKQPILEYINTTNPDLTTDVVVNRANQIVSFKVGYLMGEPVQYVGRGTEEQISEAVNRLNEYMFAEDKPSKDKELADWFTIAGTSYRMILPDGNGEEDEAPFEIYTLDPRDCFVVYHNGLGNKPKLGVKYVTRETEIIYSCYTDKWYFEISEPVGVGTVVSRVVVKAIPHALGSIPIFEYPANNARLGAFEIVLSLLDSINLVSSDRVGAIQKFVQAMLMFKGVDIESEDFLKLKEMGAFKVPIDGDVKYLVQELNQSQTQTLADDMYDTVLTICGMPTRNSGYSGNNSTGLAVIMRDGWSDAEARAKDSELMFKLSEKKFLKLALRISNQLRDMNLKLANIEIRFTRRNYDNIQSKAQVLTTMLDNDLIHPRLAYEHCGMFVDPELAYKESMEYAKVRLQEKEKELQEFRQQEVVQARQE